MKIRALEDAIRSRRAYLGLLKVLVKVKALYDAVVRDCTTSSGWNILITWFDSTKESTQFQARRNFEQLVMRELKSPNEYLSRAYVLAKHVTEARVDGQIQRLTDALPVPYPLSFSSRNESSPRRVI